MHCGEDGKEEQASKGAVGQKSAKTIPHTGSRYFENHKIELNQNKRYELESRISWMIFIKPTQHHVSFDDGTTRCGLERFKSRPFKSLQTDTLAHTLIGAFDVGTNECECMPLLIVAVSLGGTPMCHLT